MHTRKQDYRQGRALARAVLLGVMVVLILTTAACGSTPALAHTMPSDETLAQAVLEALAQKDVEALARLSLARGEFERLVWPSIPASRADVAMPMAYVWQDTGTKSRAHLHQTLARWGGRRFALVRVRFDGETTDHGAYTLSRKTQLVVRDEQGEERTLRLFGSIIRQDGQSKVYSYIID